MEDQTSWKGHSFTLLVFTGIVVLCSIFFILGMLVGRSQGQKIAFAASAASKAETKAPAKENATPELTFYDLVKKPELPTLEPPPSAQIKPVIPDPPKAAESATPPPHPSAKVFNYQIAAFKRSADAEKLLNDVKKKGFRAFILAPAPDDAKAFFRLLVGPFGNVIEAEQVKKELETAGYKPILKK
jgi:cell division septation protein DedD